MVVLVFSKKSAIISRLIRFWTWGQWSHVDFMLPDGRVLGSRAFGGVAIRELPTNRIYEQWETDLPDSVIDEAMKMRGTPYHYVSFLSHVFRAKITRKNRVNCSEFIAIAAIRAGEDIVRTTDYYKLHPRNLYLSLRLKKEI